MKGEMPLNVKPAEYVPTVLEIGRIHEDDGFPPDFVDDDFDGSHACEEMMGLAGEGRD